MDDLAEELNSVKEQIENLEYKIAEVEKKKDAAKQAVSIEHDDVKRHRANLDLEDLCTHLSYLREEKKQLREKENLLLRLRLQSEQEDSEPITIIIYEPEEEPDTYPKTFTNAKHLEKFMDRGSIKCLFQDGKGKGIDKFNELVEGAVYTTAMYGIPKKVKDVQRELRHLGHRRENEMAKAIINDLELQGMQAKERPDLRVIREEKGDVAEFDAVVEVEAGSSYVVGSRKTHVHGDSDVYNLKNKIDKVIADRDPFKGHPIQGAFMADSIKHGQEARVHATCNKLNMWHYQYNGRNISRVQMRAAARMRFGLV